MVIAFIILVLIFATLFGLFISSGIDYKSVENDDTKEMNDV